MGASREEAEDSRRRLEAFRRAQHPDASASNSVSSKTRPRHMTIMRQHSWPQRRRLRHGSTVGQY
eukprot:5142458-Lingulodinium_polyedra.AAC.1